MTGQGDLMVRGHDLGAPPTGLGEVAGTGNGHNHGNPTVAFAHLQSIFACIEHCRQRRDGRGRWRAEDACADALQDMGTSPAIADACAAAARRIGAWLHAKEAT